MNFQDLNVYKQSSSLFPRIYNLVKSWQIFDQRHLGAQLIRATNSIHANIAEGQSKTTKDYMRFISISIGSCDEVRSHLLDSLNVGLITKAVYESFDRELISIGKQLTNLKKSLQSRLITSP